MPDRLESFMEEVGWKTRFDDEVLVAGKKMSSPKYLRRLNMETVEDGWVIAGEVDGFEWEVNLWDEGERLEFDSHCGCEVGRFCIHVAAGLIRASRPNTLARLMRGGREGIPDQGIKKGHREEKFGDLEKFEPSFRIVVAEEPAGSRVVQLLLQALKVRQRETWLVARPVVRYGNSEFPLVKGGGSDGVKRDRAAEFRAMEELTQLGMTNLSTNPTYRFLLSFAKKQSSELSVEGCWFPDPHLSTTEMYWPWFRAKASKILEDKGWLVEVADNFGHDVHDLDGEQLDVILEPTSGGWFTLSVGIDLRGEKLDLLPILTGLLDGDTIDQLGDLADEDLHLIYLPSGGALQVPAGRLRSILHHLAALTDPKVPQLHPLDVVALVESEALPLDPPVELKALRRRLSKGEREHEAYQQPEGLRADLRNYQKEGVEWMAFLRDHELNGILADDMGLGKTVQTLAHILRLKMGGAENPVLVVAPTSVVSNWLAEAKKFAPGLRGILLQGAGRRRLFTHIRHADLVVTSFALLQRDIEELKKYDFELVVLDEAQHIKNPQAKVSQAACQLKSKSRLCLSGTPVENNLGELWSLFRFLLPGFLGPLERFRKNYQTPIEKDDDEERWTYLRKRLGPLILRRTKDEVAKELPPKTVLVHPVDLNSDQRDLYETVRATMDKEVRQAIAARGLEQSQFAILDALLKLRQICCHPRLLKLSSVDVEKAKRSAKLDYLFELLDTLFAEGRRVLLFSQFTSMLELIEKELKARSIGYLKLTGDSKDRGNLVERFQLEEMPIFLISLKAGGTGLTLTAADTVIHFDPWWNPAAENQATDRAYRIGQDKPVFVHKLICSGTVEDRIHQLQQKKAHLADSLFSGAAKAVPDSEALRSLLEPCDQKI